MRKPSASIKSVKAEYSFEPTEAHISKLAFILGRTLRQDEKDCLTLKLTGSPVPYTPASRDEPADGGYCEDVQATYDGKDIDSLFEDDEKSPKDGRSLLENFESALGDDWNAQVEKFNDAWECEMERRADAAREDALDRKAHPENYPDRD
jgi:hypothetical protein